MLDQSAPRTGFAASHPRPELPTLIRGHDVEAFETVEELATRILELRGGRGLQAIESYCSHGGCDTFLASQLIVANRFGDTEWLGAAAIPDASVEGGFAPPSRLLAALETAKRQRRQQSRIAA